MTSDLPPDPVHLISDPRSRRDWIGRTLERAAGRDRDALRAAAAFLAALEVLALARAHLPPASPSTSTLSTDPGCRSGPVRAAGIDSERADADSADDHGLGRSGEPGASAVNVSADDGSAVQDYMQAMYCHHKAADASPAFLVTPPLPLGDDLEEHVANFVTQNSDRLDQDATQPLLERLLRTALPSTDAGSLQLDTLLSDQDSPEIPQSLPSEVMRAIAASLRDAEREPEPGTVARPAAHRQAVATVLDHYTSTECSNPSSPDGALLAAALSLKARADGGAGTATAGPDEATLPHADVDKSRTDPVADHHDDDEEEEEEEEEEDEDVDTRSVATGIREAHESITRKDDKLTWLLGDGFRAGPAAAVPVQPTPPSPHAGGTDPRTGAVRVGKTKRIAVPPSLPQSLLLASTIGPDRLSPPGSARSEPASSDSAMSSYRSPHHVPHARQDSSISAMMPLLRRQKSASTLGTGRISETALGRAPDDEHARDRGSRLLRKRSLSTGEGIQLLTSLSAAAADRPLSGMTSTWSSDVRTGAPFLGPPVASSAWSVRADKPFANLAPVSAALTSVSGPALAGPDSPDASASSPIKSPRMDRNALTHEQRRELVRRSRKLEGFFGVPFQEEAAQRVLVDGALGLARSYSTSSSPVLGVAADSEPSDDVPPVPVERDGHPAAATNAAGTPRSPVAGPPISTVSSVSSSRHFTFPRRDSPAAPRMQRSSSSPSRRSSSFSSFASADHAYYSDHLIRSAGGRTTSDAPLTSSGPVQRHREEREERRKKLEKVRRFLGERVPVDLVFPNSDADPTVPHLTGGYGPGPGLGGHGKSASEHWRKGKRLLPGIRTTPAAATAEGRDPSASLASPAAAPVGIAEWPYIEPEWQSSEAAQQPRSDFFEVGPPPNGGVDALSRARKLENLFGQLPPSSLYLGPDIGRLRPPPPTGFSHRRSVSDYAPSSYLAAASASPTGVASSSGGGDGGAAETYRRSIASLSYVAERDPVAMDEVVRVYTAHSHEESADGKAGTRRVVAAGERADADEEEVDDDDDEEEEEVVGLAPAAASMTRSVSAQSVRAVRQAHKLSQVLGTTKGAVWHMLLRDLQEAILDDATLDEEERADVLRALEKLRRTGMGSS
ncbi:hypothetical protein JCM3774_000793 [Rhodotorula dairenensis]